MLVGDGRLSIDDYRLSIVGEGSTGPHRGASSIFRGAPARDPGSPFDYPRIGGIQSTIGNRQSSIA